eukprot:TRINITY_DN1008_c0_g1_i1.p1 TRINITY_DN1008_c0_g1~~TRINITY_DN1008_c0_g1_i1.p1  ORF type:complete len:294 (-),score=84.46 TRINITY_DN1008_c0_g1_i1:123-1004(-)
MLTNMPCFLSGSLRTNSLWNWKGLQSQRREFHWTGKRERMETKDPLKRTESLVDKRVASVGYGDTINRNVTFEERERINQTGQQIPKALLPRKTKIQMRSNVNEELLIKRRELGLYKTEFDAYHPSTTPSVETAEVQRKMVSLDMNLPQIRTRNVETITLSDGTAVETASGNGSRKKSMAAVTITPGTGSITINDRPLSQYFIRIASRELVLEPLLLTHSLAKFNIEAKVWGGGLSGQAGAIQLAIARALQNWEPFNRPVLKQARMLRRDPRKVERKKYGQKKARKKFQWVKR